MEAAAPKPEPKPEPVYEDPAGIQKGMDSAEVERRFGPPALKLTMAGEEVYSYTHKGAALDVTMRDGKVAVVRRSDGTE